MQVAILAASALAAVAAVAAVIVPLWQQRVRVDLVFTGGFSTMSDRVQFSARVENNGRSPVFNVELFSGPAGLRLDSRLRLAKVTLQPGTSHEFTFDASRPEQAEIESGEVVPTLAMPLFLVARYGKRATISQMPPGPYDSDRAQTRTQWSRALLAALDSPAQRSC